MLENLQETLKKTLFAGVGATVMSADAVKNTLADLVKKGKLSADDAKAAFDKAASRGEEDAKSLYEKATSCGKEALENINIVAGMKQLAALEKRVAALEEKLGIEPAPACPCEAPVTEEPCACEADAETAPAPENP